jgi:metal-dependent amidase/aminoacylase/carboxypeptidase family protein
MMGAEDFAYYAEKIPALFMFIGAGNKSLGIDKPHHHPEFDIDETSLEIALDIFKKVILYS